MANVLVNEDSMTAIADAIRAKKGVSTKYKPNEMPDAISSISGGGGITPTGTINITQNGTHDVTNYASANVNVPTGGSTPTGTKQISITANGTTTEDVASYANAEITVNVQSGGGSVTWETIVQPSDIIQGGNNSADGSVQTNTKRIRNDGFIAVSKYDMIKVVFGTNASMGFVHYYNSSKVFQYSSSTMQGELVFPVTADGYIIVIFRNTTETDITPSDYDAQVLKLSGNANAESAVTIDSMIGGCGTIAVNSSAYSIRAYGLAGQNISSFRMPNLTTAGEYAFSQSHLPESVILPKLGTASVGMFKSTKGVKNLVLPAIGAINVNNIFGDLASFEKIDIGASSTGAFTTWAFSGDTKLNTLILRRSSVVSCPNVNVFNATPFASGNAGGTLYVPSNLVASYQSATTWSTILGYETNQILPIEGSIYETQYADGTPIA